MGGLVLAWLFGEGIVFYRSWKNDKHPPMPGQILAVSGIFLGLGLLAQNENTKFLAAALGWGFDIAAFMNIAPEMLTGYTSATKAASEPNPKGGQKK